MAVAPKLSDAEIASLMEIPHPSKDLGESIYGATKASSRAMHDAVIEYSRTGAIVDATWML